MRMIAMTLIAAALASPSFAVEYVDGQVVTFADGRQEAGIYLPEHNVMVIWTSKAAPAGPIYGISILPRGDVLSTKPLKGKSPANSYPVNGAVFEPEAETLLAGEKATEVLTALGMAGKPVDKAVQARSKLAAIKAAAMKRIKP